MTDERTYRKLVFKYKDVIETALSKHGTKVLPDLIEVIRVFNKADSIKDSLMNVLPDDDQRYNIDDLNEEEKAAFEKLKTLL